MPNESSLCVLAEVYANDTLLNVALVAQIVLCFITLTLLAVIAAKAQYRKIVVHLNFKILFVNVTILCGVVSIFTSVWVLRFQLFHVASSDPCSLLVPVWFSIMVRFPTYMYGTGFPLWHLAMTVERLLSTVQADKYEYARPTYSVVCSALVWTISVGHTAYHTWLAMDDPQFSGKIVYATLSTATNAHFLTVTGQIMVGLDLSTMLLDAVTVCLNRKLLKRSARISSSQSVSFLPVDICNAICYVVYQGGITTTRYYRLELAPHRFQSIIESFYVPVLLQAPISLVCLIIYAKNQRRKPHVVKPSDETELYFTQLRRQLGTDRVARSRQCFLR